MRLISGTVIGNTSKLHWAFRCHRCNAQVEVVNETGLNQYEDAIAEAEREHAGACEEQEEQP